MYVYISFLVTIQVCILHFNLVVKILLLSVRSRIINRKVHS